MIKIDSWTAKVIGSAAVLTAVFLIFQYGVYSGMSDICDSQNNGDFSVKYHLIWNQSAEKFGCAKSTVMRFNENDGKYNINFTYNPQFEGVANGSD